MKTFTFKHKITEAILTVIAEGSAAAIGQLEKMVFSADEWMLLT